MGKPHVARTSIAPDEHRRLQSLLPVDAASATVMVKRISAHLTAAGLDDFRSPPSQPTTCCSRGCNGCVWEGYYAAVGWWRDDALELLADSTASATP
ncbi:hypothetical protein BH09PSE5_BH09PSE5_18240 [soil metagenome]